MELKGKQKDKEENLRASVISKSQRKKLISNSRVAIQAISQKIT